MRIQYLFATAVVLSGLSFAYILGFGAGDQPSSAGSSKVTSIAKTPAVSGGIGEASQLEQAAPHVVVVNAPVVAGEGAVQAAPNVPGPVPVVELSHIRPTDARTRAAITRGLQNEFARLGCYRGPKDGRWSAALTFSAKAFAQSAGLDRDVVGPDYGLLDAARKAKGKVCTEPVCYSKTGQGCDDDVQNARLFDREGTPPRQERWRARTRGISEDGFYTTTDDGGIESPAEQRAGVGENYGTDDDYLDVGSEPAMGLGGPGVGVVPKNKVIKRSPPRRRSRDRVEEIFKHPLGRM